MRARQLDTGNDVNSLIIDDPKYLTYDALVDREVSSPDTVPFWLDDYRLGPDSPLVGAGSDGGDIGIRFPSGSN